MAFGEKPEDAAFYAVDHQRRFEFIAWRAPVEPDGDLTLAVTGRTRAQLVRDILDGRYDRILHREATA